MTMDYRQFTRPLKVAKKIFETPDAVSLVFEIPKELQKEFVFQPGQFVTLFLVMKDDILPRSYSISSSPIVDDDFKITIKRVPGGRGSTHIVDQVKEGDTLFVTPPAGNFFRPAKVLDAHHYVLFAGGSGITPIYSILKSVLAIADNRVSLFFSNSTDSTIIYHRELKEWVNKSQGRLHISYALSRPPDNWHGLAGRATKAMIENFLSETAQRGTNAEYYLCGPDGFMDIVKQTLRSQNISDSHIHQEVFTSSSPIPLTPSPSTGPTNVEDEPPGRVYIGDPATGPIPNQFKLVAQVNGSEYTVSGTSDQTILEVLMAAGANPPYSCMDGACMACIAKVREGRVYQNDPGILMDESIENRETLTCQARAASPVIKIDYDGI